MWIDNRPGVLEVITVRFIFPSLKSVADVLAFCTVLENEKNITLTVCYFNVYK